MDLIDSFSSELELCGGGLVQSDRQAHGQLEHSAAQGKPHMPLDRHDELGKEATDCSVAC